MSHSSPGKTARQQGHGAEDLGEVVVEGYNLELRDEEGFVGDKASERAFRSLLEEWRERIREVDEDPLGDTPTGDISKRELDGTLTGENLAAAGVVHGAVEEFAAQFAAVLRRFLRQKSWQDVRRVVVGGGMQHSRTGHLVIGRAGIILKAERIAVDLCPLHHQPDDGGLIGWVHAAPADLLAEGEAILAVDIGGTNMRCGIVELNRAAAGDLSKASVRSREKWRHAEDEPERDEAIDRLAEMLKGLAHKADESGIRLAPFIGIACPGMIGADGSIRRGAQNLPGDWEEEGFNLPEILREKIPELGGGETRILMHNDAVVQGLSELPWMRDVARWAVVTVGTGLGNASYANKKR